MSKKKMRAFAGAMAVVLAFVPFLSGCAANDAEDNPQAQQELNADEQSRNEAGFGKAGTMHDWTLDEKQTCVGQVGADEGRQNRI